MIEQILAVLKVIAFTLMVFDATLMILLLKEVVLEGDDDDRNEISRDAERD